MNRVHVVLAGVVAGLTVPGALAQRASTRGLTQAEFGGWPQAIVLESRDAAPRAVVVPSVGGRVMSYGSQGENVLWLDPEAAGRTLTTGGGVFQPGGFHCEIGPEVAALPPHPELTLGPYEWTSRRRNTIDLRGAESKAVGVEMEKEVVFDPANGDLGFVHRIKNTGERDAAYCLWHRIACKPGGFVLIPLNAKSRFPAGWSMRRDTGGRPSYDGVQPSSGDVQVLDGVLVAKTGGAPAKVGADSDAQWVAYALGTTLLVVHFPVYSSAIYSEAGNTVTVEWDARRTELQPLSPEARLRSRKSYDFPMKWSLIELPSAPSDHRQARALAERVPGSPFL